MNRDEWRNPNLVGLAVLAVLVIPAWVLLIAFIAQRCST